MEESLDDILGEEHQLDPGIRENNLLSSILIKPMETFRVIFARYPNKWVTALIAFGAARNGVEQAMKTSGFGTEYQMGFALGAFVGSAVLGFFMYYVVAYLLKLASRWLGGRATYQQCLTIGAWSVVPQFAYLIIIPLALFFDLQAPDITGWTDNPVLAIPYVLYALIAILALVFSVIIYVSGVRVANDFGVGRAIGALFLAAAIAVVPFVVIALIATNFFTSF